MSHISNDQKSVFKIWIMCFKSVQLYFYKLWSLCYKISFSEATTKLWTLKVNFDSKAASLWKPSNHRWIQQRINLFFIPAVAEATGYLTTLKEKIIISKGTQVKIPYTGDHNKHVGSLDHPGESHVSVSSNNEDINTKHKQKSNKEWEQHFQKQQLF